MLPVDTTPAGPAGLNVLGRAQYMLTPCQHLFHTECLERVKSPSLKLNMAKLSNPVRSVFIIVDADKTGVSGV